MTFPRRTFLRLSASAVALPAFARFAHAQAYPSRPVRIVVGFAPGGATDILARIAGQWLSTRLGQQFIVENRPGANGNLATEGIVKATADGHSLLMIAPANTINATLFDNLSFNFIRDIAPVAGIIRTPIVMEVNLAVPAKTVPEFIGYAKANPGKINMASAGNGVTSHVSGELFKMMTGVNMVHVPYRGAAPALTDLLAGQVQVYFDLMPNSIGYIRAGKVRPLAITTAMRSEVLPDLPTLGEFVPGYEVSAWYGLGVPRGTPAEVIDRLNKETNAGLADPRMKERFADLGGTVLAGTPGDFEKLVADETEKWGKVVKFAGIKPD